MKYTVGSKLVVSPRATSLQISEYARDRKGMVYTVIHAFNDGMNTDRITLKADQDEEPSFFGIPSDNFELAPPAPSMDGKRQHST